MLAELVVGSGFWMRWHMERRLAGVHKQLATLQYAGRDDDYAALKEFNASYEGETSVQEHLHLEYQRLLTEVPGLEARLAGLPRGIFSGRERVAEGSVGVFLCYRLPALDTQTEEFTLEVGVTRWYFHQLDEDDLMEDPKQIAQWIRSDGETPRVCTTDRKLLVGIRDSVLKHIKNTYLKQLDVPIGSPKPLLVCWMEVNAAP